MIKKLTLVVGLGAGYVLGAKAGTQRYDQIMGQVNSLLGRPEVQRATDTVAEKASAVASDLTDAAKDKAGSLTDTVKDKASEVADKAGDKAAQVADKAGDKAGDKAADAADAVDEASGARTADPARGPVAGAAPSDTV